MLIQTALMQYGANVSAGLERCMKNEGLYFRLIEKVVDDRNFQALPQALAAGDLKAGFEAAHALKGVLANLELTPILTPVSQLTELLRGRIEADYRPYLEEIAVQRERLIGLFR